MSSRSYLSIGDVLTLLRQEFPDVTISKIRFLESQGLVNPERTPSGYRKFYEHDVERLRWVLRQQREHFLPLKVIKDRLDDEADEPTTTPSAVPPPVEAQADEEPVLVGQRASADAGAAAARSGSTDHHVDEVATPAPSGRTLPGIETGSPATNGAPAAAPDAVRRSPARAAASAATAKPTGAEGGPRRPDHAPDDTGPAPARTPRAPRASASPDAASSSPTTPASKATAAGPPAAETVEAAPSPPRASRSAAAAAERPKTGRAAPSASPPAGEPPATGGAVANLSIDELAAASGVEVATLESLVDFGLLVGTKVAGHTYFDDEALQVATLAAGFARFGVEPRHLRLYKNAAEREAGFVEQIVIPVVRQRNPEARARAHETVDELARLGQELRASLLRSALGNLLDG